MDIEVCRKCKKYDADIDACAYLLRTGHTRGQIVQSARGRRIVVYPEPCDKYEPLDDMQKKGARSRSGRKLQSFPERDKLYAQGLSDHKIAEALGTSSSAILGWRRARGLPPNDQKSNKLTKEEQNARLKLYYQGMTDRAMAEELGDTVASICSWRRRMKLRPNASAKGGRK